MSEGADNSVVPLSERLRHVASQGQFDLVKELVKAGAEFNADQEGRTALHYAALSGHVDICQFLLQQGCSIDDKDVLGYTPLHRAASKGHKEAIEFLLSSKCNVDSQDEHGNGAIHEASWNGFSQTLEILIKFHCNVVLTNKSGFTALHLASQNGHNESARVLLYGGCNADLKNNYGDTALHTAARYGHAGVTRILISARCRLNEQNKNGDTALHISSALKRKKIAKLLVEAGIDINVINKQEETAIDVARRKDHPEIIMTITSLLKTKSNSHPSHKVVNFSEIPVDLEGPVIVPNEDVPMKTEKSEKTTKFFSFLKKKKKDKDKPSQSGSQVHPTSTRDTVQGFFSQYIPKTGQQYYRDLAGNIKQGPVGYTPICQCMPALQQLEQKVDKDKEHIYEHIDASHQILKNRMDQIDRRTSQQIIAHDQWSRQRFDEEERNCYSRIDQRISDHQHYVNRRNQGGMNVDNWLEAKLSEYGHCLDHHHDDSALPSNNIFMDIHQTENGRLFRSRSDETLSQSDNHSGKFRKKQFYESRQQAMQEIRAWQLPGYSKDRNYRNTNPVVGRRGNYNSQNSQTFNRNTNQQSMRQNVVSPVASHPNTRSSSRPEFISPSTVSTSRSPYMSHDQVYESHYSGYEHGAIPRRLPTSQTWHGANELQTSVLKETNQLNHKSAHELRTSLNRESSPLNHSTPKSRESSPFEYQHLPSPRTVKNEFQNQSPRLNVSGIENRKFTSENKYVSPNIRDRSYTNIGREQTYNYNPKKQLEQDKMKTETFDRLHEVRRSQTENRSIQPEIRHNETWRSFPERGSSNTSTGTNMTSNSSNTGQGPLKESSAGLTTKPTFTTFGYPEKEQKQSEYSGNVQRLNSGTPSTVPNVNNSFSKSQPSTVYGYYSSRDLTSKAPNTNINLESSAQRYNGPSDYLNSKKDISNVNLRNNVNDSGPTKNRDDMYISAQQNFQMPRQRSRSSDGILLDDDILSAHDMKLKLNDSRLPMQNSTRSGQGQNINLQQDSSKRSMAQYGSERSFPQERNYQNSRAYLGERNSQYFSASNGGVSQTVRENYSFSAKREVPSNGYNSEQMSYNRDRPYLANGNSRDNIYGDVKNYVRRANDSKLVKTSTYNDRVGHNSSVYADHSTVPVIGSQSESTLNHPHHSPADRNLQSTPIQDKSREDNSSNPDSGYSSKIFGRGNANSTNVPSNSDTPSSSFSTEPTDHNLTLSSNNSPHPHVNHSDYAQINSVRHQYQKDLSSHVQQWYQRKLKDAAKNLNEEMYGNPNDYNTHSNDYRNYDYVQPSRQSPYHSNQLYSSHSQVPNYIRGSDV